MATLPPLNPNLLQAATSQTIGGSASINVAYGTYELTLTSNTTLTLNASSNGVGVTLYLKNAGYTLTVAGAAPGSSLSVTGRGSYLTVVKTSDGWIGGASVAVSGTTTTTTTQQAQSGTTTTTTTLSGTTTTSTTQQAGTTTTTTTATPTSITYTSQTSGAAVSGLKMSGGETVTTASNANIPLKITSTYGATEDSALNTNVSAVDSITMSKQLARMRLTVGYSFSVANSGNYVALNLYNGTDVGGANLGFRIYSNGKVMSVTNEALTWTSSVPLSMTGVNVPLTGTAVLDWDAPAKTGSLTLNGVQLFTVTGTSSNWKPMNAGVNVELNAYDSAKVGVTSMSVGAF